MTGTAARTRFAPSPTGYLHVGGARTALFNWLVARQTGGQFILRIEDTDRRRHVADSLDKILADLRWLGLQWDEGPEVGGPDGPYFQSERRDLYDRYCQRLLESDQAYYAFDTADELAAMREHARRAKHTFKYPRPESLPTAEQVRGARAEGKPVVVRFKTPDHDVVVRDVILGEVTVQHGELEDFVIRKADGLPTYHFACVVDDAAMRITHVLRGSEHLSNTPKHIALQQALDLPSPTYAHLPIIFNMSGSKMSKRDKDKAIAKGDPPPEIDVHDFRLAGYLPEALLNFIALLGWAPGDDREQFSPEQLVQAFGLERIGKANARFDHEKLLAFNTEWSANLPAQRLLEQLRDYLTINDSPMGKADDGTVARVLEACAGFRTFADVVHKAGFIFSDDDAVELEPQAIKKVLAKNSGEGYAMLERLVPALEAQGEWSVGELDELLAARAGEWGVGFGKVAQPIRVAVSGTTVSPQIGETLAMLGKERTLARMQRCLAARQ